MVNKLLVKKILENATDYRWSLQGFGMLRLYLADEVRLHVWDKRYQIEDVSIIHTHPWNFRSTVIAGAINNIQYREGIDHALALWRELIVTGEQATAVTQGGPELVHLENMTTVYYVEGDSYYQPMHVPHKTLYEDGSVTVIERDGRLPNNHAYSYWPQLRGPNGWVSAAPRTATLEEVLDICGNALERWFGVPRRTAHPPHHSAAEALRQCLEEDQ